MFRFLSYTPARILTLFLLLQAVAFYALGRTEPKRLVETLGNFPKELGEWRLYQEGVIEKEVMDVLKADDVISRTYVSSTDRAAANLFIAYFETQRTGKAPHSPKNCLPGSGWLPIVSDKISIDIPGRTTVEANRYVVAKGEDRSLVIYWYQTANRTVASEYKAKMFTIVDSIQHNRSDTAIVKITMNMPRDMNEELVTEVARKFARAFYDSLTKYFPA